MNIGCYNSQEALEWGLVNRVVPHGEALNEAMKMAAELCENAPLSVQAILKSLRDEMMAKLADSSDELKAQRDELQAQKELTSESQAQVELLIRQIFALR